MRLIDIGPLKERIDKEVEEYKILSGWGFFFKVYLDSEPIIDIVRCKECRWAEPNREGDYNCRCHIPIFRVGADDYCSYGERKNKCNECWYWLEVHKRCENKYGCQFKPYEEKKVNE